MCVCAVIFDVFGTRATKNIVCFNGTLMPICLYTGIYIFKWTVFPLKFDQQSTIIKTQPHRTNEYFQSLDYYYMECTSSCFVSLFCHLLILVDVQKICKYIDTREWHYDCLTRRHHYWMMTVFVYFIYI